MQGRGGPTACAVSCAPSLSVAGLAATAVSFGPGRMGFGLFVPEFRSAFHLSTSTVGYVSSLGFLGFLVGLLAAQFLLNRRGPAAPVLTGLLAATAGLGIVACASDLPMLAIGVFLAASSAGFAWTPFNDAVHRKIHAPDRPSAFSEISTGTSIGIVSAGMAALAMVLMDFSWRYCWALFAIAGAAAFVVNRAALRSVDKAAGAGPPTRWRALLHRAAIPLFLVGFVYGTTSAIFISFAPDHLRSSGALAGVPGATTPALVFICFGLFGLAGFFTGQVRLAIGLPWLLRLLMLAGALSLVLIAVHSGSWVGLIGSAGLQGLCVMMTSAVLALWSERLFPCLPSLGFTAALLATAAGSVLGPAVAGVLADTVGARTMFAGIAALPACTAVALRRRHIRDPAPSDGNARHDDR